MNPCCKKIITLDLVICFLSLIPNYIEAKPQRTVPKGERITDVKVYGVGELVKLFSVQHPNDKNYIKIITLEFPYYIETYNYGKRVGANYKAEIEITHHMATMGNPDLDRGEYARPFSRQSYSSGLCDPSIWGDTNLANPQSDTFIDGVITLTIPGYRTPYKIYAFAWESTPGPYSRNDAMHFFNGVKEEKETQVTSAKTSFAQASIIPTSYSSTNGKEIQMSLPKTNQCWTRYDPNWMIEEYDECDRNGCLPAETWKPYYPPTPFEPNDMTTCISYNLTTSFYTNNIVHSPEQIELEIVALDENGNIYARGEFLTFERLASEDPLLLIYSCEKYGQIIPIYWDQTIDVIQGSIYHNGKKFVYMSELDEGSGLAVDYSPLLPFLNFPFSIDINGDNIINWKDFFSRNRCLSELKKFGEKWLSDNRGN